MPIPNELQTTTLQHFIPLVVDQVYRQSPLLYRIFRIAKEGQWGAAYLAGSGREVVEPLQYQEVAQSGAHGAYDLSDTLAPNDNEILTYATYSFKRYHVATSLDNLTGAENVGKARLFDLAALKVKNATQLLRKDLATDLYGDGDGTGKNILGLQKITAVSGTVGGIDKTTYTWWRGAQNTSANARNLDWTILNDIYYKTKHYGDGLLPTIMVASDGVIENYENIYTKVIDASSSGVRLNLQVGQTLEGGFRSFVFKGVPIVPDPFCAANTLFCLNENFINWRILKQFNSSGWTDKTTVSGKDRAELIIKGYGALTTSACRKQGIVTNLNEA